MRIICAPDSYKESLSAVDAANAMADGIRQVAPEAEIDCCPVGDGGEGTLEALRAAAALDVKIVEVSGPFGEDMNAGFGLFAGGQRAFVESAQCIGLNLVPPEARDPTLTTSFGVGELILQAAEIGVLEIVVGVGGSSTNDGGCGMAQALGFRFFDATDKLINEPISGSILHKIDRIESLHVAETLQQLNIIVASDVSNPLTGAYGAAAIYAPQKGADAGQVSMLDAGLAHLAEIVRRDIGVDIDELAGAGAAGGLGGGLVAFAGARIKSGIDMILDAVGFHDRVVGRDLCLTGEGRLDEQSNSGKASIGVAKAAAVHGVSSIALVGSVGDDTDSSHYPDLQSYFEIGAGLSREESIRRARELLSEAAAEEARKIA